jgi:AhpD family alkylhydroperoxidase
MKLDIRTRELIAIGASITAHCQPCLQHHVSRARENGVNDQEIAEAIAMGQMIRKGAAGKMEKFAATVCSSVPVACASDAGGCCG